MLVGSYIRGFTELGIHYLESKVFQNSFKLPVTGEHNLFLYKLHDLVVSLARDSAC